MRERLPQISLLFLSLIGFLFIIPKETFATRSSTLTTSSVSDLTPDYVKASAQKIAIFTFTLTDTSTESFTQAKIKFTGTSTNDISTVYLYKENTSPGYGGTFSSTDDGQITSSSSASALVYTLDFTSILLTANAPRQFYVVVDSASNPTDGNTIDFKIEVDGLTVGGNTWPDTEINPSGSSIIDTRTPQTNARETRDLDSDGYIDALKLTFMDNTGANDPILDSSITVSNFSVSSVTGLSFSATTNGDTANDHVIYLTFTDGVYKTDVRPTVTYTAGTLSDGAENLASSFGPLTATDKAPPVAQAAITADTDSDGFIDKITVTFSEDVNGTTVGSTGNDFTVSGYTVSGADETSAGVAAVTLTEKTAIDTNQTPTITVAGNGSSVGIKDLNNNWTNSHNITPTDGAAPPNPTLSLIDQTTSSSTYAISTTINISVGNDATDVSYWLISPTQSTQPSSSNSSWVSTRPTTFTLSSSDGSKTVYIWVKDSSGNINAGTSSGSIILDTTAPNTPTVSLTNLTGGSTYSTSDTINVAITSDSGAAYWLLSESSTTPTITSSSWGNSRLTSYNFNGAIDGTKTIYLWTKDNAGNLSSRANSSMTLDKTKPTGSLSINSGETKTASKEVILIISATDSTAGISLMKFSNDGTSFSGFESYKTSKAWTIRSGTVYVIFSDTAGNLSLTYSSSIKVAEAPVTTSSTTEEVIPKPLVLSTALRTITNKLVAGEPKNREVTVSNQESSTNGEVLGTSEQKPVLLGENRGDNSENKLIWLWVFSGAALLGTGAVALAFKH